MRMSLQAILPYLCSAILQEDGEGTKEDPKVSGGVELYFHDRGQDKLFSRLH
jgi:hypothetical protein